jgi:Ser/Thr protein kinase RdoA (MazF antagonist)
MQQPPQAILDLLSRPRVRLRPLDPRGQPWLMEADDWKAVLRHSPGPAAPELASARFEHVVWLHRFLDQLAATGFPAPRPLRLLNGSSLAAIDGGIWEALSYLPGHTLLWNPKVPVQSAGAMLARFHLASLAISPADQRPGALTMELCRPLSAQPIADDFQRELLNVGHDRVPRCALHGDCTVSNMLVDEEARSVVAMIDFTLAHLGPPESDISFALWVTGRTEQPARTLDEFRVRAFVSGYHRVRPLTEWAVTAIPLYLVGRGLQMHVRLERAGRRDEIQLERLHWLHDHRRWLEDVVASALYATAA